MPFNEGAYPKEVSETNITQSVPIMQGCILSLSFAQTSTSIMIYFILLQGEVLCNSRALLLCDLHKSHV